MTEERELVEDAIRRLTDGTLTFRVDEDEYTVAALTVVDGRRYAHGWSKSRLGWDPDHADEGVRALLQRMASHGLSRATDHEAPSDRSEGAAPYPDRSSSVAESEKE